MEFLVLVFITICMLMISAIMCSVLPDLLVVKMIAFVARKMICYGFVLWNVAGVITLLPLFLVFFSYISHCLVCFGILRHISDYNLGT